MRKIRNNVTGTHYTVHNKTTSADNTRKTWFELKAVNFVPGGKFIKSKMNNLDVLAHVLAAAQQWGNGVGGGGGLSSDSAIEAE